MRYQHLTLNTGRVSDSDTDVASLPKDVHVVLQMLAAGHGTLPYSDGRVCYRFDAHPNLAAATLTISRHRNGQETPIRTTLFYLDAQAAALVQEELPKLAASQNLPQPDPQHLRAPGMATVILRDAALAGAWAAISLTDFTKAMFLAWALSRTGDPQSTP